MSNFITLRYSQSKKLATIRKDKVLMYAECKDFPMWYTRVWFESGGETAHIFDIEYENFDKLMKEG